MSFKVEPNTLAENLGIDVIRKNLVLLNLDVPFASDDTIRIVYDLIFRAKEVDLKKLGYWHLAVTSCKLSVDFKNGEIKDYTKGKAKIVRCEDTDLFNLKDVAVLAPAIGLDKTKVSLGELKNEKVKGREQTVSLDNEEYPIKESYYKTSIEWEIDMPDVKKVIREYRLGNFKFFVDIDKKGNLSGNISIKPKPFEVFNSEKKKCSKVRSAFVNFALTMIDEYPYNPKGIDFKFNEI